MFSRDLSTLVNILNKIMGNNFTVAKQFCSSLICIASQLSNGKGNGIEAFTNLLSTLQWIIETVIAEKQDIVSILEDNGELITAIEKLELDCYTFNHQVDQDLQNYKSTASGNAREGIKSESQEASSEEPMKELRLLNILDSMDNSPSKSSSNEECITIGRIDLLRELEGAILRATQSQFVVQDVYIGVSSPPADPEERLIVIYDCDAVNEDSDVPSIESRFISWLPSSTRTSQYYCNYIDEANWLQFRQDQQPEFRVLLTDFFDSACVDLIKNHSDVVAVFPSVYRLLNEGPFEPVICIVKKSLRFFPYGEESIPLLEKDDGLYMKLSSGKQSKVFFKEGWISIPYMENRRKTQKHQPSSATPPPPRTSSSAVMNPNTEKISLGDGISLADLHESYGTIGGFVKKGGEYFMMTNEHVVVKAMNESKVKNFELKALKFVSPSIGAKEMRLQRDLAARGLTYSYDTGLLFSLLHAQNSPYLKQIISPKYVHGKDTKNPQISLTEVKDFFFSEQKYFSCTYESIIFFDSDIPATAIDTESVYVSGDVALIPISMPDIVQESGKIVHMLNLQKLIDNWTRDKENLRVNKLGATTGLTSGEISRPAHAKFPITSTDRLWYEKFSSKTAVNRVLLNQILVSGVGFGKPGDSGSLVYYEGHPSYSAGSGNSTEIYAIGTFVGGLDKGENVFLVSPSCDILEKFQFEFAKTEIV